MRVDRFTCYDTVLKLFHPPHAALQGKPGAHGSKICVMSVALSRTRHCYSKCN
jgi:hypothetical protein